MSGDQIDTAVLVCVCVWVSQSFIENLIVKKQQLEYRSFLRGRLFFKKKKENGHSDQPTNDRKTHEEGEVILLPRLIRYWSVIFYSPVDGSVNNGDIL